MKRHCKHYNIMMMPLKMHNNDNNNNTLFFFMFHRSQPLSSILLLLRERNVMWNFSVLSFGLFMWTVSFASQTTILQKSQSINFFHTFSFSLFYSNFKLYKLESEHTHQNILRIDPTIPFGWIM